MTPSMEPGDPKQGLLLRHMCTTMHKMKITQILTSCAFVMFTRIIDGYLLGSEGPAQNVTCGTPVIPVHTTRIIGGREAMPGSWPWMVLLEEMSRVTCGGSILNEYVVLTAAHCFDGISRHTDRWKAYAGKHHVTVQDPMETSHHIRQIIVHPQYNNTTLHHDIALVILREPIVYTDYIRPVCLPPDSNRVVPIGAMCYATGWGETRGTADPNVLNQVGLPLLSAYWCSRADWYASAFVFGYTFCAGYASGGKDACAGDSGGPYNCKHEGKWYAQGVTSWGYYCAQPKYPGIYTDVSKYGKWIRNMMKASGQPLIG